MARGKKGGGEGDVDGALRSLLDGEIVSAGFEIYFCSHQQVFRKWNKQPSQVIIVSGGRLADQNVLLRASWTSPKPPRGGAIGRGLRFAPSLGLRGRLLIAPLVCRSHTIQPRVAPRLTRKRGRCGSSAISLLNLLPPRSALRFIEPIE
jgi:hypothetical protein